MYKIKELYEKAYVYISNAPTGVRSYIQLIDATQEELEYLYNTHHPYIYIENDEENEIRKTKSKNKK